MIRFSRKRDVGGGKRRWSRIEEEIDQPSTKPKDETTTTPNWTAQKKFVLETYGDY
jgi:hypothetical protein